MADALNVEQGITRDLLETPGAPALSSTSDMPVVETKPDAQNEGAPPAAATEEKKSEEAEQPEESATSATDEQSGEPAKKESRGVQKALDRLTAEREEQRRLREATEKRLDEALEVLKRLAPQEAPRVDEPVYADPEPLRPVRSDFADPDTWEQALLTYAEQKAAYTARHEIAKARAEEQQQMQQSEIQRAQEAVRTAHAERVEKFKSETPDFDEFAARNDVEVSMPMAAAILHSEHGPQLQYYLGKNPTEAKRIFNLSPPLQLLELGRIEASFDKPAAPAAPAVQAKPKPINPITPASDTPRFDGETASMDEYAKQVRAREGWADPQRPKPMRH